jgi:hypothetical protein
MGIVYSSNTAITFDISSLATSSSLLVGRECTQWDNTSNLYNDILVNVDGITGHASTAPTIGQYIGLWAWGSDTTGDAPDTLAGSDANRTLAHASVKDSLRFVAAPTVTSATAGLVYYIQPFSIRQLFGGVVPKFGGLFLSHNHNGALAASQTGLFTYNGITYT